MLRENLQNALKEAMKNHDTATVSAVRLIIAGQKEKDVAARGAGKECASDADLQLDHGCSRCEGRTCYLAG